MANRKLLLPLGVFALLILISASSWWINGLWGAKLEGTEQPVQFIIAPDMTIKTFADTNKISEKMLQELFGASAADTTKIISSTGMSIEDIQAKLKKLSALEAEFASKNWIKIPLKFAMWILFMAGVFMLIRKNLVTSKSRKFIYAASFIIFGVILGSDPGPMGTIKDAIVMFGKSGAVFLPRLVAFLVFMLAVFVANKFICSWGCQVGTLQDFLFRMNRNSSDTGSGVLPQIKVPFIISNSVRVVFFVLLTASAFLYGTDIIEPIDPFKIFNPLALAMAGLAVVFLIFLASIFIYRPWCHFLCPFGLAGWIVEGFSLWKISVDYDKCIACEACAKACPSTVMSAILKQHNKVIPDCFSCAVCMNTCPVGAISLKKGKRQAPPKGKFSD